MRTRGSWEFRSPRIAADKTAHAAEFQHDPDGAVSLHLRCVAGAVLGSSACVRVWGCASAYLHVRAAVTQKSLWSVPSPPEASCAPFSLLVPFSVMLLAGD